MSTDYTLKLTREAMRPVNEWLLQRTSVRDVDGGALFPNLSVRALPPFIADPKRQIDGWGIVAKTDVSFMVQDDTLGEDREEGRVRALAEQIVRLVGGEAVLFVDEEAEIARWRAQDEHAAAAK